MDKKRSPFDDFELIYSYTTQDALDDGTLVDAAIHPDLRTVTLLNWNTNRIRVIVSSGLLATLRTAGNIIVDWQRINRRLIEESHNQASDFTALTLKIGDDEVMIWVGCEPFGADDPTPKLTFYLPEEH